MSFCAIFFAQLNILSPRHIVQLRAELNFTPIPVIEELKKSQSIRLMQSVHFNHCFHCSAAIQLGFLSSPSSPVYRLYRSHCMAVCMAPSAWTYMVASLPFAPDMLFLSFFPSFFPSLLASTAMCYQTSIILFHFSKSYVHCTALTSLLQFFHSKPAVALNSEIVNQGRWCQFEKASRADAKKRGGRKRSESKRGDNPHWANYPRSMQLGDCLSLCVLVLVCVFVESDVKKNLSTFFHWLAFNLLIQNRSGSYF